MRVFDKDSVRMDLEELENIAKPLFYGFTFLTGVTLVSPFAYEGTMLGLSVLSAISLAAAGMAKSLADDWSKFLELVSLLAVMTVIFFASYLAMVLAMT